MIQMKTLCAHETHHHLINKLMNSCQTIKDLKSFLFLDQCFRLSRVTNVDFHVLTLQLMNDVNRCSLIVLFMRAIKEYRKSVVTSNSLVDSETYLLADLTATADLVLNVSQLDQQTSFRRVAFDL